MTRGLSLLLALVVATGLTFAQAPTTYTIKLKKESKGDSTFREDRSKQKIQFKLLDPDGKALVEKADTSTKNTAFKETILEKPDADKRATKLTRTYTKAEIKSDGKERKVPYEGKSVLIEKKGDRYQFRIEGGEEITGADAKELETHFNRGNEPTMSPEKMLIPEKPVSVGETWNVKTDGLKEMIDDETFVVDPDGLKATGKLLEVYSKNGRQWGKMEYQIVVPLKAMTAGAQKLPLDRDSFIMITMIVNAVIDGSAHDAVAEGKANIKAIAELPMPNGDKAKMVLSGETEEFKQAKEAGGK